MMKLSGWKHRLEAFAATRRKAVETQSSHRREGAGRHKNTPGPPVNGENISLDVPFYRTAAWWHAFPRLPCPQNELTHPAGVGAQLSRPDQGHDPGDESTQSGVSRLGYCLWRTAGLCAAVSRSLAEAVARSGRAASSRATL